MAAYRPKHIFQSNSAEREAWQSMSSSPILHRAIAYAQADMAFAGFSPYHMDGATAFILGLLNLSENEEVKKTLPIRRLASFDDDAETLRKMQELLKKQQQDAQPKP